MQMDASALNLHHESIQEVPNTNQAKLNNQTKLINQTKLVNQTKLLNQTKLIQHSIQTTSSNINGFELTRENIESKQLNLPSIYSQPTTPYVRPKIPNHLNPGIPTRPSIVIQPISNVSKCNPTRPSQPVSAPTCPSKPVSISNRSSQHVSALTHPSQSVSIPNRSSQPVNVPTRPNHPVSVQTRPFHPVSVTSHPSQPITDQTRPSKPITLPTQPISLVSFPKIMKGRKTVSEPKVLTKPGEGRRKPPNILKVQILQNKENAPTPIPEGNSHVEIKLQPKQLKSPKPFKRPNPVKSSRSVKILTSQEISSILAQKEEFVQTETVMHVEPAIYPDITNLESKYIGDMERTFEVFESLEARTIRTPAEEKVARFMNGLDCWGVNDEIPGPMFNGFFRVQDTLSYLELPEDWRDDTLFHQLDEMTLSEQVFLNKWLPQCSLQPRTEPYRNMIRKLNRRDPQFNIVW